MAIGMMACALTTSGGKKVFFWLLAALFAFLSLVYADALPQFGLPLDSINRVITALLAPVILVGVAAMLRDRRSNRLGVDLADIDPGTERPVFAASTTSKWKPDITFQEGMGYLAAKSTWPVGQMYVPSVKDVMDELTNALGNSQITAWGKAHPDDEDTHQIDSRFWLRVRVTADTNYAFSENRSVAVYDIHLSQEEMKLIWPPRG